MNQQHRLHEIAPFPIEIIWHENNRSYLSFKKRRDGMLQLRLHRLFFQAPTPVLEALIAYVSKREKSAKAIIRQMAHLHFSKGLGEPKQLERRGAVYDLDEIFAQTLVMAPVENVSIGWSSRTKIGDFRSITFGTYDQHHRLIRINPLLDSLDVPKYFLEFVVYHEMLHAIYPSKIDAQGKCSIHTKEFREKERQFPHFKQAKLWEKGCFTIFKKRKG